MRSLVASEPEKYGQTYEDFTLEKVRTKQRQASTTPV